MTQPYEEVKKALKEFKKEFPNAKLITYTETIMGTFGERGETKRFIKWLHSILCEQ